MLKVTGASVLSAKHRPVLPLWASPGAACRPLCPHQLLSRGEWPWPQWASGGCRRQHSAFGGSGHIHDLLLFRCRG